MTPVYPPWTKSEQRAAVFWACALDVLVPKPGNVHRAASFADLTAQDFLKSAEQVRDPLSQVIEFGVGQAILASIQSTRERVATNTNLGIVLLLAPLSAVPWSEPLSESNIATVLKNLTVEDAKFAFRAITLAQPGGMGKAAEQDINDIPTVTLLEAMQMAADRDTIAAQYTHNFPLVREAAETLRLPSPQFPDDYAPRIIRLALWLMSRVPDTLIARKCGPETAREAARRAAAVLESGVDPQHLANFDAWLRADGNRRNPGTTADLVVATLYDVFRNRIWTLPSPTRGDALLRGNS